MKKIKNLANTILVKIYALKIEAISVVISLFLVFFATLTTNVLYQNKKLVKRGFEIEISKDGNPPIKKEEKQIDLATLIKTADFDRGMKIFKKCASCHTINKGEPARVGPNLFGIIGKSRGSFPGFSYSVAMKTKGGNWDRESINSFITKPKEYLAGTKMAFPGLKKAQDRADVILYLERQK